MKVEAMQEISTIFHNNRHCLTKPDPNKTETKPSEDLCQ